MLVREPAYCQVTKEADVANLIPGDRVSFSLKIGKQMVATYAGHMPQELSSVTKCTLIELPEGYNGEEVDQFDIWESYLRFLQFPCDWFQFNLIHTGHRIVSRGTEEYVQAKSLVDMI